MSLGLSTTEHLGPHWGGSPEPGCPLGPAPWPAFSGAPEADQGVGSQAGGLPHEKPGDSEL